MAKAATIKIKLLSTADTGYFYVTKKNARTKTDKFAFKKLRSRRAQARRVQGNQDQVILELFRSKPPLGGFFSFEKQLLGSLALS